MDLISRVVLTGVGATIAMDLWGLALKRGFGVRAPDYTMVGRWIGHMPEGQFKQPKIAAAPPVRREALIGWTAHFLVGVAFATLLLAVVGREGLRHPSFWPALAVGVLTVAAPFFVMQPGMGLGIASSKAPKPNQARLRSLAAHTVFGLGLFASAWLLSRLFPS